MMTYVNTQKIQGSTAQDTNYIVTTGGLMFEKDKIYSLRLSDSSEIICKVVSSDETTTIISHPFSLIPTQQGVQLLPAMMSADETKNVTINTNNITMHTETNKDIIASYIQASTGIVTPAKGILKG